ncbi:hypothetical protein CRV24_009900 [Beauveria bassiana]|nr:hypothetical protein CRV24_009900 [Beauveria bassiana]
MRYGRPTSCRADTLSETLNRILACTFIERLRRSQLPRVVSGRGEEVERQPRGVLVLCVLPQLGMGRLHQMLLRRGQGFLFKTVARLTEAEERIRVTSMDEQNSHPARHQILEKVVLVKRCLGLVLAAKRHFQQIPHQRLVIAHAHQRRNLNTRESRL